MDFSSSSTTTGNPAVGKRKCAGREPVVAGIRLLRLEFRGMQHPESCGIRHAVQFAIIRRHDTTSSPSSLHVASQSVEQAPGLSMRLELQASSVLCEHQEALTGSEPTLRLITRIHTRRHPARNRISSPPPHSEVTPRKSSPIQEEPAKHIPTCQVAR